jgi:hypothetical protein
MPCIGIESIAVRVSQRFERGNTNRSAFHFDNNNADPSGSGR